MMALKLTTCQAINTVGVSRAIADYLGERLRVSVRFVDDIPWKERYRLIGEGKIHIGWICGLPYAHMSRQENTQIRLLAAPVMRGSRYDGRPVYFSDVVVHRSSPFRTFADLRGATWAYNESGSHSGYNVACYHLASLGETTGYFGQMVRSGAHRKSLAMVVRGQVDASAIDSTVLEWELEHQPELRTQVRVVETIGPSPIPPWVMARHLQSRLRQRLQELLLQMHEDREGRLLLAKGRLDRFVAVKDEEYDVIRRMFTRASQVRLVRNPKRR